MMRWGRVGHALGVTARTAAVALLVPAVVALFADPWDRRLLNAFLVPRTFLAFLLCSGLSASLWLPLRVLTRPFAHEALPDREGFVAVALGWPVAAALAATPLLLLRFSNPVQAFFEAMSGLTGTGVSALANPDALPASLLFWRSFLHWIGGLAWIVLSVSLLARLTHNGLQWMGPARTRWHLRDLAQRIGTVYLAVTLAFATAWDVLLTFRHHLTGVPALLESLTQTFAAYGNGAFAAHAEPLFSADPWILGLRAAQQVAGALNIPVAIVLSRRDAWRTAVGNPEIRFFAALLLVVTVAAATLARSMQAALGALAVMTGAGSSATPPLPASALLLVILAALTGGTVASAAGGISAYRALVLLKSVARELRRLLHPKAVIPLRVGGRPVPEDAVLAIIAFFFMFLTAWIVGAGLLAVLEPGLDLVAAATGALAALANVAFGTGAFATASGFSHLHPASLVLLSGLMWLGRLELFAALLLFMPNTWRN